MRKGAESCYDCQPDAVNVKLINQGKEQQVVMTVGTMVIN